MEDLARGIMRYLLVKKYMDGLPHGDLVEDWLKEHKGWLPDPQEIYGDRTPMTQPCDEGMDVRSEFPQLAVNQAFEIMLQVRTGLCLSDDPDERRLCDEMTAYISAYEAQPALPD